MILTQPAGRTQTLSAAVLAIGMAVTVGTALGFQHIGGYIPCKLCLEQRLPYYIGIPVMALALLSSALKAPPVVTRGLLLAGALLMSWGLYMGVYHSGVEWGWWPGPTACTGTGTGLSFNDLAAGSLKPVIACDAVQFRFLGISLAGYNALISAAIVVMLLGAMLFQARRKA